MVIIDMTMPKCCDECWALDDYGDYPRCRITDEQRGYTFRTMEKRMDRCPLRAEQTEPQTDEDCDYCKMTHKYWYEHCDICKRKPKDEPQTEVETMSCQECKHWIFTSRWGWFCPLKGKDECNYEPIEDEPQTDCAWK